MKGMQNAENMTSFFKEESLSFFRIIIQLYRYIWFILIAGVIGFFIAILNTLSLEPQYQTSSLIQINPSRTANNLGLRSYIISPIEAELALIKTRYILEPVVKQNALNITVEPKYFPIFGEWMAKRHHKIGVAKPFLGYNSYAWGGEKIKIKQIQVPVDYQNQTFKLVTENENSYKLFSNEGNLILFGEVGKVATSNIAIDFKLEIESLVARPGTEFIIKQQSVVQMASNLSSQLTIENVGRGGDLSANTGVLKLTLTGQEPNQIVHVLNSIVDYTVKKNSERKSKEAEKTLNFLHERLPELKKNIQKSESELNKYLAKSDTFNIGMSSQFMIQEFTKTKQLIDQIKTQQNVLQQTYTPLHPLLISSRQQEIELKKKLGEIKDKIKLFQVTNQEGINLEKEIKIKGNMYQSLLNNIQQLELVKAGIVSDIVSLADATPPCMLSSKKYFIWTSGFLIGLLLAALGVLIKEAMNKTIDDSDQLEEELQIPVQAIIPFSKIQKQMEKKYKNQAKILGKTGKLPLVLAKINPDDVAIESFRSLRISLQIMRPGMSHQCICVMGSMSNIGKTFVSMNFAQILAEAGKKTLLIDGDIRKGRLHRAMDQSLSNGLSEYLNEKCELNDIFRVVDNNFYFISCGKHSNHPIELFQSKRFQILLEKVKQEFDHIVIDSSPVLAVIDSILIAAHCETKLFVVNAAKDYISDVKQAVKKVKTHGINIDGIVVNYPESVLPYYGYGTRYYAYRYAYGSKARTKRQIEET